jgi:predicted DNA-binding transcriptional regulator AlpA/predicted transcriptional regulator
MEKEFLNKMGLLEDRILRIIELREKGLDDKAIASELGLDETTLKKYEDSVKTSLNTYARQGFGLRGISRHAGFSQVAAGIVCSYYRIDLKGKAESQAEVETEKPEPEPKLSRYQISVNKIRQAIKNGAENYDEIVSQTGLRKSTVYNYVLREAIPFKSRIRRVAKARIESIKQAIENGAKTSDEIAERTGLSLSWIYYYSKEGKITIPVKRTRAGGLPNSERKLQLEALAEDANSIEEIAKESGMKPISVYNLGRKLGIKLPGFKKNRYASACRERDRNRDRLIRRGLSLGEISKAEGITRERIRQYIVGTGQHESWRKSREHYKRARFPKDYENKQELEKIAGQIIQSGWNRACEKERKAYLKTLEYCSKVNNRTFSFEQLFNFFEKYFSALKNREKLSLKELGKSSGIHLVVAGKILGKVDLEPLHGKRKKISRREIRIYERAHGVEMPVLDIAYFSDYSPDNLNAYFSVHRDELGERPKNTCLGLKYHLKGHLDYRLASEVYQAEDLGFSKEEILDLFDMSEKVYGVLCKDRKDIKGKIIEALRTLNPDKVIDKPYRN